MTTLVDETFATSIPGGFGTVRTQGGTTPTATYNSGQSAVDLIKGDTSNGGYSIDGVAAQASLSVTFDLELVSVLGQAYLGAFFVPSLANGLNGSVLLNSCNGVGGDTSSFLFFRTLTTAWAATTFDASWAVEGTGLHPSERATFTYDTYVVGAFRRFVVYRDGILISTFKNALTANMQLAVLFRNCTLRLHRVIVTDTPTNVESVGPVVTTFHGLLDQVARKIDQAPPNYSVKSRWAKYLNRNGLKPVGGNGIISGTTKTLGILPAPNAPYASKVRLYQDLTGVFIAETTSNLTTGYYEFLYLDRSRQFTVVAYDNAHSFRAVIDDNVTPDVMP
jgi:hypothetical protein